MAATATWLNHDFNIYEPNVEWYEVAAVYIFATPAPGGGWIALYVGETSNIRTRLASHEKWPAAKRLGATHIHTRGIEQEQQRLDLESLLIQRFDPPLNVQIP